MNPAESIAKKAVKVAERELLDAMQACDVNRLGELLHEDLLFVIPSGQTISRSMDLETYRNGNMKIQEISSSEQKIHLIGDNAIVSTIIKMIGSYFDFSLDGTYKVIRIWKSLNEKWQVIGGSSTIMEKSSLG